MAWKILATAIIDTSIKKVYESPADSGVTHWKIVISNYSPDIVTVYMVWTPWWDLTWWELTWVWSWTPVTFDDKKRRILYKWELKQYERFVEDNLMFGDENQIRAEWEKGICNIIIFGDLDVAAAEVEVLKGKVLAWTATSGEKEKLMLLSWGAYNVNNNVNNCNCW